LEVRKQDGSAEYEPDSLKVIQAALEQHLSAHKYPYSVISSREFASSRAALDAAESQATKNARTVTEKVAHSHTTQPIRSLSGLVAC